MYVLKSIKSQTTNPDNTISVVVNILDDTTNTTSTANSTFPQGTTTQVATAYFQSYVDGLNTPPAPPVQAPDTTKQDILNVLAQGASIYTQLGQLQAQLVSINNQVTALLNAAAVKRAGS